MKIDKTNKVSFTPGPWNINRNNMSLEINFDHIANKEECIIELSKNAHLITAAPEMLIALEDAINYLNCGDSDSRNFAKEIQLILNKAKGE